MLTPVVTELPRTHARRTRDNFTAAAGLSASPGAGSRATRCHEETARSRAVVRRPIVAPVSSQHVAR